MAPKDGHHPSMYKMQADPIFFPGPDCRYQYASPHFFSIKNLKLAPDPLNKGKIDFFIADLSSLKLLLQEYIKKTCKNPQKKPKTQLQVLIFFPKKQKSYYFPPPPTRKLAFYTRVPNSSPASTQLNLISNY